MEIDSLDPDVIHSLNHINRLPPDSKPAAYDTLLANILTKSRPDSIEQSLGAYLVNLIGSDVTVPGVSQPSEYLNIASLRPLLDNFVAKLASSQLTYGPPIGSGTLRPWQPANKV